MLNLAAAGIICVSLVLSPALGIMVTGDDPVSYFNFPFHTAPTQHHVFTPMVWWAMVLFVIVISAPFLIHVWRAPIKSNPSRVTHAFPLWGWVALLLLFPCWVLAWSRFHWLAPLQEYTFTPLWLCYLVIVNAFSVKRRGHCLLTDQPRYLLGLAILSCVFWWYYEYLNGFIRNWYYSGLDALSTPAYVVHASLAYATVLPAVISSVELLNSFPRLRQPFTAYHSCRLAKPRVWAAGGWSLGCVLLVLTAVFPEQLFMCAWVAPLFIIIGTRTLLGQASLFSSLARRDWRPLILPAVAALICGLFWEMWNAGSYAHWEYNIPYVDAMHLFEMPVIGYAGYIPFGMVCLAIAELLPSTQGLFE